MFGFLGLDGNDPLKADGTVAEDADPWAKRAEADLCSLVATSEDFGTLWEEAEGAIEYLFKPSVAERFGQMDVTVLRR